jgi:hypothetical protein
MNDVSHKISIAFGGWAFSTAVRLDQSGARGLVADICRIAAPLKRQAAFVALAAARSDVDAYLVRLETRAATLNAAIRIHTARQLACAAFDVDDVRPSFLRALERIGLTPLETPDAYSALFALSGQATPQAEALQYCNVLTSARIRAAEELDLRILSPAVLNSIDRDEDIELINAAVHLLSQCCSILDEEEGWRVLREHLARYGAYGVERMLKHADRFLLSPCLQHPGLTELDSAESMVRAGNAFNCCLKERVVNRVLSQCAYYIVRLECIRFPVILELIPVSAGWRLQHMQGPKGCTLSSVERQRIVDLMKSLGVIVNRGSPEAKKLGALFRAFPIDHAVTEHFPDISHFEVMGLERVG